MCDVTGLFVVTSFIAFGSFGTVRGAIAFGAAGIGLAVAVVPVGVVAMADLVERLADGVQPVVDVTVAVFEVFWSAFSLLGILFTRDRRWLTADGAAAAATLTMRVSIIAQYAKVSNQVNNHLLKI